MKQKNKKAIDFLKKYQYGGYNQDDTLMQNPYEYAPDLQSAQQQQIVQFTQPKTQGVYTNQPSANFGSLLNNAIPFISPAINLGIGVKSLIDSFKERKRQKQYERAYKRDLTRRMEESRTGDYYHTTYENYQLGGQTNLNQISEQSQMDMFIDFYNQQENNNDLLQEQFKNYYTQKNDMYEQQWRNKRKAGFQNLFQGAIGLAKPFLQEGGTLEERIEKKNRDIDATKAKEFLKIAGKDTTLIKDYQKMTKGADPEKLEPKKYESFDKKRREQQEGGEYNYNPRTDLYSSEYDPDEFLAIKNELEQVQIEDKEQETIEEWLFQDDETDPYQEELNADYFDYQDNQNSSFEYPQEVRGLREFPIKYEGDISTLGKSIAVSHNNPGNIKYGDFSKRYGATEGKQATDGGNFAKFPDVKTGLKAQQDLLKSSAYANLSVSEAMGKWSNSGYGGDLYPEIASKQMNMLNDNELIELQRRQIQREDPSMYRLLYLK